jgi:hypothetical protein
MYVVYDLQRGTRGEQSDAYPRVKRVYIAGQVKDWKAGGVRKKTGREVHGVRIEDEQSRKGYQRRGYSADRGETEYRVQPATIGAGSRRFAQVVEISKRARNVRFYSDHAELPVEYRQALQRVR